ncbi:hypothetical protein ENBRE01_2444 [Enteropsectra breve]|nr:hypothetical protein ENBRE01_2444 [Enteropsectra breve]
MPKERQEDTQGKGICRNKNSRRKSWNGFLKISPKEKIIMAIDYFSRYLFAKVLETKQWFKTMEFIKEVYKKLPFKTLVADNGCEFNNEAVKEWTSANGVKMEYSIPYYHESNGRIERANRTIRDALKRVKGADKIKLGKIIDKYNNIKRRGIGMSPVEAKNEENREQVIKNSLKYSKEFKVGLGKKEKFTVGQKVILRNEQKAGKMDDEFKEKGKVILELAKGAYKILTNDGNMMIRHNSQLKGV